MVERLVQETVRSRAEHRCEYCRQPERFDRLPFQIDHVIARQHGGSDDLENLALACFACNHHKGPNIAGLDPESQQLTRLFDPRNDLWSDHFRWDGPRLVGRTPIGSTTIQVLQINRPYRIELRASLMREGVYPL